MGRIDLKRPTSVAWIGSSDPAAQDLGAGVGALDPVRVGFDAPGPQPLHFFKPGLFDVGVFCRHFNFSFPKRRTAG